MNGDAQRIFWIESILLDNKLTLMKYLLLMLCVRVFLVSHSVKLDNRRGSRIRNEGTYSIR